MAVKHFSIVMDLEIDDDLLPEDDDFPTLEELETRTKKYVEDVFAAEVDIVAAEGTLIQEFGVHLDE